MCMSPQSSYVENLVPNLMVLGGGVRPSGGDYVMRAELL